MADVWWYIHFLNRWGDVARAHPAQVMIVRYQDLQADPAAWLRRILDHVHLPVSEAALHAGLVYADRDAMRARQDVAHWERVIPEDAQRARVVIGRSDRAAIDAVLDTYLRHDLTSAALPA